MQSMGAGGIGDQPETLKGTSQTLDEQGQSMGELWKFCKMRS